VSYDLGRLWKESFVAFCLNKVYCIQHLVEVIEESRRKLLDHLPTIAKFVGPFEKGCTNFREKKKRAVSEFYVLARRH
jgi:hypothetical protein